MRQVIFLLCFVVAWSAVQAQEEPVVKKSSSGICHSKASPYFDRTQSFSAYDSMALCVTSGGKAYKSKAITAERKDTKSGYYRSAFGRGWSDRDKDCQNTRHEVLSEKSTTKTRWDAKGCNVIAGQWISFFSGNRIYDAEELDIDHIVPLKWAWDHGAWSWNGQKREQFANDPRNLEPVEASLNRSKGAKGPLEWLPPSNQCSYLARFKRLVVLYKLELSAEEDTWFDNKLATCRR